MITNQSMYIVGWFLLYFTILGNSFWQKRFLNIPLQNATLVSKETGFYICVSEEIYEAF